MSAAAQWYFVSDDQQQGPVERVQLDGLMATGAVTDDTLVWSEGMPDWLPVRDTPLGASEQASPPPRAANLNERVGEPVKSAPTKMRRHNRVIAWLCAGCSFMAGAMFAAPIALVMRGKMPMIEALQLDASESWAATTGAILLVGGAAFLTWSYRATRNLFALRGPQSVSPAGSVYWYFVPVLNLWKPLQAMKNLHRGFGASKPWMVSLWWGLFWLSNLADLGVPIFLQSQPDRISIETAFATVAVINVAAALFYFAGLRIVLDISKAEQAAISGAQS
ncbi:DUF4328 domain-containing protein [Aureimonas psammosilenae]|uniref:DUF4328 domain-containing protein n=1 Tax=Aureimonas psammosilenae TaxID=2495496 RepID=UPI0012611032|nr:DUF4328 domain-containing protein [Aureimonas psammosilenae]